MKLCTFTTRGRKYPGLVLDTGPGPALGSGFSPQTRLLDLSSAEAAATLGYMPECLEDVIRQGVPTLAPLLERDWPAGACHTLAAVRLCPPVGTRAKVLGVARNYHSALRELRMEAPQAPAWFVKLPNTLVGPDDAVRLPEHAREVTYEAEIALVIGRKATSVTREEALGYIAGFTLLNDVSASDIVRGDGNFLRGKNPDTFCPLGPFILTSDEIADPQTIRITLEVDGKRLQDGTTADMVFGMAELIRHITEIITLEPGDVIATGTPAGVAATQSPKAWLMPGQIMRVSAPLFGVLQNPIV